MQMPQNECRPASARFKILALIVIVIAAVFIWRSIFLEIAGILLGAAAIAFFLSPLYKLFEKKLNRPLSALLAILLAAGILSGMAAFLLPAFLRQLMQLGEVIPEALGRIAGLMEMLTNSIQRYLPGINLAQPNFNALGENLNTAARSAVAALGNLAGSIYRCFLAAVLSYFLICDRNRILLRLELLFPLKWRRTVVRSASLLVRQLRLYLRGQATIALAVGSLAYLAMLLLGLQGALVLGITVGVFNIIPYFGPFLGGIPAVIAALGFSWQRALWMILALFLIQQVDGLLISPRIMGGITGFSPAVVLLALFAGGQIGGITAMLLALPVLMTFRTVYRVFVQLHENN